MNTPNKGRNPYTLGGVPRKQVRIGYAKWPGEQGIGEKKNGRREKGKVVEEIFRRTGRRGKKQKGTEDEVAIKKRKGAVTKFFPKKVSRKGGKKKKDRTGGRRKEAYFS